MKNSAKTRFILIISIIMMGAVSQSEATSMGIPRSINTKFAPVVMPKGPGPVTFELEFMKKTWRDLLGKGVSDSKEVENRIATFAKETIDCKEVQVRLATLYNMGYNGDTVWTVEVDSGVWYRRTFDFVIPPNDTCGIVVEVECCRNPNPTTWYFVTTGDTLECYRGNPRYNHPPEQPVYDYHNPKRDTLTQEQLNKKYTIAFNVQKSSHLQIAKRILGELPDSCKSKEHEGMYIMKITLDQVLKLLDEGIDLDAANWDEFKPPEDTTATSPKKGESTKPQGIMPVPESQK